MGSKRLRVISVVVLLALLAGMCGYARNMGPEKPWQEYGAVCHALGMTKEGDTLTNSREAFEYNYGLGQRVFETDIQITSDNVMVLRHDWGSDLGQAGSFGWSEEDKPVPTADAFCKALIYGKYTPLTLKDWFGLMKEYPDIYMVTDTKYSNEVTEQFRLFADTAISCGCEDVLQRVVVQLYYPEMYEEVMAAYPFQNILLSLYYIGYQGEEKTAGFCREKGIPVLVMPSSWWNEDMRSELEDSGVKIYLHTVDDPDEASRLLNEGADGLYTDIFTPVSIENMKEQAAVHAGT